MAHRITQRPSRGTQAGVTLLETLVVLVIIAAVAGTMLQSVSSVAARQDAEELTALAARITTLSDQALATGLTIELSVDKTPWTVTAGKSGIDLDARIGLAWLSSTSAENFIVQDGSGSAVSTVVFRPYPAPQEIFFALNDTQIEGQIVLFDGLSARVISGAVDG